DGTPRGAPSSPTRRSSDLKRTGAGAATDASGRFTLSDVQPSDVLAFRSVGYQDQEVAVSGKATFEVTMEPDMAGLDEVVVVGYRSEEHTSELQSRENLVCR